jgi:hypothetical protein
VAAQIKLTLHAKQQALTGLGDNVAGAFWAKGENAGHIRQGLAKRTATIRVTEGV